MYFISHAFFCSCNTISLCHTKCQFPWLHRTDCLTLAGWTGQPTPRPSPRPTKRRTNRPVFTTDSPTYWYQSFMNNDDHIPGPSPTEDEYGGFTLFPTMDGTRLPTYEPSPAPSKKPTPRPIKYTGIGVVGQTDWPTFSPTTEAPTTAEPTVEPTISPTDVPTEQPTETPPLLEGSTCLGLGWHFVSLFLLYPFCSWIQISLILLYTQTTLQDTENKNGCTDNDVIKAGWTSTASKNRMFYKTSKKCCEAFFPGKKCKVFDYGCGTSKDPPPPAPGSSPEMPGSTGVVGCVGNSGKGKYGWHMVSCM